MTSTFTGRSWTAAVASSHMVIWKPPSPTMATTVSSGRPNWAPTAAGKP